MLDKTLGPGRSKISVFVAMDRSRVEQIEVDVRPGGVSSQLRREVTGVQGNRESRGVVYGNSRRARRTTITRPRIARMSVVVVVDQGEMRAVPLSALKGLLGYAKARGDSVTLVRRDAGPQ